MSDTSVIALKKQIVRKYLAIKQQSTALLLKNIHVKIL